MILAEFIADAVEQLRQAKIDNPQLDVRWLACHALNITRTQLLTAAKREVALDELKRLDDILERRVRHESVARIIGSREFWGLSFGINEATLEPRPDSETLVEAALKLCGTQDQEPHSVLDLGTGTGCLLLSLLHEWKSAKGLGIDLAPRAIEQAQLNANALELADRASFQQGSWFDGVTGTYDVIVSNPPYIKAGDIEGLMSEVRNYDPHLALDGGEDGLAPYRLLLPKCHQFLSPGGLMIVEMGQGQVDDVVKMFEAASFSSLQTHNDLAGITRCVSGRS